MAMYGRSFAILLALLCAAQHAQAEPPGRGPGARQVQHPRPMQRPLPPPQRPPEGPAARDFPDTPAARPLDPVQNLQERERLRRDLGEANPAIEARRREIRRMADERFRSSDLDADGALSRREMQDFNPRAARAFERMDLNADGRVTADEMRAFIQRRRVGPPGAGGAPEYEGE